MTCENCLMFTHCRYDLEGNGTPCEHFIHGINTNDKIIKLLREEIVDCGEPDISARPIAYGTILGLKAAVAIVETVSNHHE